jgi:hypothetical protein
MKGTQTGRSQAPLGNVPFAKLCFARLVKQSFTEVRSQAELGNEVLHYSLRTAKMLPSFILSLNANAAVGHAATT